jgi:putative MATE family efflux protein
MNDEKKYLNLALPSGFECIIGILITMTDVLAISRFGSNIIATVGAMGTVINFMYLVLQFINVSNNVTVAELSGANDKEKMKITTGTALIIAVFCSLFCILFVLLISGFLPQLFLVDKIGLVYLYIRLIGVIPNTILTILSGYQRTLEHSKKMLYIRILCFIINAILDFIFVYYGLGIVGVALSTVFVEIINMIILINCSKGLVKLKFDKDIAKEELLLVKYNIYERIFKRGSDFLLNIIISRIGSIQYAAHLVLVQFIDLINNFLHGTGIGTQTIVAKAIGTKDKNKINSVYKIVEKTNKKMSFIITAIIIISLLITLPYFLIDKESLAIGYNLSIFVLIDCLLSGFYNYYSSILRAMKKFKYISFLSLIISGFLKLILAYTLSKFYGIYGVWICFIISDFIMNVLLNKKIMVLRNES